MSEVRGLPGELSFLSVINWQQPPNPYKSRVCGNGPVTTPSGVLLPSSAPKCQPPVNERLEGAAFAM